MSTQAQLAAAGMSRRAVLQGALAGGFLIMISLALVLRFLATGEGYGAATISVVAKRDGAQ